jgi:hypothetical protein
VSERLRQIYVAILEGGPDAWRRVDAVSLDEDAYRIVSENDRPAERWEYTTGQVVRCRPMTLPGPGRERVLVATQRVGGHDTARPDVAE